MQLISIFLSGDRLAISYAYIMGIPCIKPSSLNEDGDEDNKEDEHGEEEDEHSEEGDDNKHEKSRKILTFYNSEFGSLLDLSFFKIFTSSANILIESNTTLSFDSISSRLLML